MCTRHCKAATNTPGNGKEAVYTPCLRCQYLVCVVHNKSKLYQIDVVSDHVTCFFLIFTISIWHIYELAQY